jgi:hypothetical protein
MPCGNWICNSGVGKAVTVRAAPGGGGANLQNIEIARTTEGNVLLL